MRLPPASKIMPLGISSAPIPSKESNSMATLIFRPPEKGAMFYGTTPFSSRIVLTFASGSPGLATVSCGAMSCHALPKHNPPNRVVVYLAGYGHDPCHAQLLRTSSTAEGNIQI